MSTHETQTHTAVAHVNGVALHKADAVPDAATLRQRACFELLRQTAQQVGLLDLQDECASDGILSEQASDAIEALLAQQLQLPEPTEQACRRFYTAHQAEFAERERVRLRHILFAVTVGVDVVALRKRAEQALLEVRCQTPGGDGFATAARELSNCPSAREGGHLGWLTAADCASEFAREIFGKIEVGVLPRLVHSRFGLHVVEVLEREPGRIQAYETVAAAVRATLRQQTYVTALRQYISVLAGEAMLEGVDLQGSDTPLVQ